MFEYPQSSVVWKMAMSWFERTGRPIPKEGVLTTCYIKLIAIYQWFWIVRAGRVPGMKYVRWWMVIAVSLFAFFSWADPDFMREVFIVLPLFVAICALFMVVIAIVGLLFGSAIYLLVKKLKLESVIKAFVDFVKALNDWFWGQSRVFAYLFFIALLTVVELGSLALLKYADSTVIRVIAYVIFIAICAPQAWLILGSFVAGMIALNDRHNVFARTKLAFDEGRQKVGLISPKELAELRPDLEPKPYGLYALLMEWGLCKFVKFKK